MNLDKSIDGVKKPVQEVKMKTSKLEEAESKEFKTAKLEGKIYKVKLIARDISDGIETRDIAEVQEYFVRSVENKETILGNAADHFEREIKKMYNIK